MKTFSVAVAVAVVLTFICIQENSAVPVVGVQEIEEMMSHDSPVPDSGKVLPRQKRAYCFRCCDSGVCRTCCYA